MVSHPLRRAGCIRGGLRAERALGNRGPILAGRSVPGEAPSVSGDGVLHGGRPATARACHPVVYAES